MERRRFKKIFLLNWISIFLIFGLSALFCRANLLQTIIYTSAYAIVIAQSYNLSVDSGEIKITKGKKNSREMEHLLYFLGCWVLLSLLLFILNQNQVYFYELFISALLSSFLFAGCYLLCKN